MIDSIFCFDHVGILIENPNIRLHVETAQYLQKYARPTILLRYYLCWTFE